MNEAFVSADAWAKSAIKKRWFNLSEGECFGAQIFDENLFLIDTVTFANKGKLKATFGSGSCEYYAQFKRFLSEKNFRIKIKTSQQSIYEQLYKNNEGLRKCTTIELSAYLEQTKKQRTIPNHTSTEYPKSKKEVLGELTTKEFVQAIDNYVKEHASKIEIPDEIRQIFSMLVREIGAHAGRRMLSALCATYGKEACINKQHLNLIASKTQSNIKPDTDLTLLLKEFIKKSYIDYSQFGMSENIKFFRKQCFNEEEVRGMYLFVHKGIKARINRWGKTTTAKKLRSTLMSPEDLVTVFLEPTHISERDAALARAQYLLGIKSTIKKIDSTHTPKQLDEEELISTLAKIIKQRMSAKKKAKKSDLAKQAIPIIDKLLQTGLSYKQIAEELQTQGVNVGRNVLIGIWDRYGEKRKGVITRRRIHALHKRHTRRGGVKLCRCKSPIRPVKVVRLEDSSKKPKPSNKEQRIKSHRKHIKKPKSHQPNTKTAQENSNAIHQPISEEKLLKYIDRLIESGVTSIKETHAKILDKNTDKSTVNIEDIDNATLIDITILEPYSYKEEERVQLAKLLYELLQGNLDKHKKALELKKQLMEQYGLSAGDFVQIRVKIVIKGRQIFHETTFKI